MRVLKGCALALLSFILFFWLVVFGLVYSVNQIALNPHFIIKVVDNIDFSSILNEMVKEAQSGENSMPPELVNAIQDTVAKTQPLIKERFGVAVEDTYDYLLGKANAPDLKTTLGDSFMNPDFVSKFLDEVDISNLMVQIVNAQTGTGESGNQKDLTDAITNTITKLEPSLKQQVAALSDPVFKYMLGKTPGIDLRTAVRNTVLSRDFVVTAIDSLDIKMLTQSMLKDQLGQLPEGIQLTDAQIDRILSALEPAMKSGLITAADPIADYLVGSRPDFSVIIPLQPVMPAVKPIMKEAFLANLPPELQTATPADIDQAFALYWTNVQQTIPANFQLDSGMFGTDSTSPLTDMLNQAQDGLAKARDSIDKISTKAQERLSEVRTYIGYFKLGFAGLIILLLLIVGGIVLIHRSVKGVCRDLGITSTIYGAITFAGILLVRYLVPQMMPQGAEKLPQAIESLLPMLLKQLTSPLFTLSLICLIGGIGLIVVSFVYPGRQTAAKS